MTTCHYGADRGWLTPEHLSACADPECAGCRPCSKTHCAMRGRCASHVEPEAGERTCPRCIGRTRGDLRTIVDLYALVPTAVELRGADLGPLLDETAEAGIDSEAFNLIGPAADPGQYGEKRARLSALYERQGWCEWPRHEGFRVDDPHHPYAVLGRWDMAMREHYGPQTDLFVNVTSAADYLTKLLGGPFPHSDEFDEFSREIAACRAHLESVIHDDREPEKGAPCPACSVERGSAPRLRKRYAAHPGLPPGVRCAAGEQGRHCRTCAGLNDTWHCPDNTAHWWGDADYRLRIDGDYVRHATVLTAAQIHEVYGIKPGILRKRAERNPAIRRGRNTHGQMLYDVRLARHADDVVGEEPDRVSL